MEDYSQSSERPIFSKRARDQPTTTPLEHLRQKRHRLRMWSIVDPPSPSWHSGPEFYGFTPRSNGYVCQPFLWRWEVKSFNTYRWRLPPGHVSLEWKPLPSASHIPRGCHFGITLRGRIRYELRPMLVLIIFLRVALALAYCRSPSLVFPTLSNMFQRLACGTWYSRVTTAPRRQFHFHSVCGESGQLKTTCSTSWWII